MSIFQKSVIQKHLSKYDANELVTAYNKFNKIFNAQKISRIKDFKEEEYQDGFLRDLFVEVLGYTLKTDNQNFNLEREFKNQSDGKKADGAIIKDGKAVAVIELKSTKTKDLTSITEQAFNYKNNQPGCKYIITSNFQKIRFFIDYSNEYEEFDLFNLQQTEFNLLYLILNKESILTDKPQILKDETKFHEQNISKELYNDYSNFKRKIYDNLVIKNPQIDKLTLFKKSQKLLDRLLFIFFAEDCGLLPPNSITRIIEKYERLKDDDFYQPLYVIYKQYFGYMNIGRKGKVAVDDIPAYNGGLFASDEVLDNVLIDDKILKEDCLKLSAYDFNTDVDVNILGHIFEHSLSEIEEMEQNLTLQEFKTLGELKTSKRKKDGVFYTPKYITQYIVENTIGTLCVEKRKEMNIYEIEFDDTFVSNAKTHGKAAQQKKLTNKGKELFEKLNEYKKWLLSLKILDPACGSGAFLNQALLFLISEHKLIDNLIADLTGDKMGLFNTDKEILENNLFGVDINEESVEIAKLSLWLRTAQKGRKLSSLNDNIKCGNSLIDDPEVAGDKAFDWYKEFPQMFKKKDKKAWHITTATHNSIYSQRMFDYKVKTGEAIWLSEKEEIIISETIAEIVKESKDANNEICPIDIVEYNICGDHLHMLLVCEEKELTKIVGKIKAMTARRCNIEIGRTIQITKGHATLQASERTEKKIEENKITRGHAPLPTRGETQSPLWTQKFGKKLITDNEQYTNTINYIRNNRKKHELPENKNIEKIINSFLCDTKHAFRDEYNGGFDVVIGNPPYFNIQTYGIKSIIAKSIQDKYPEIWQDKSDIIFYFIAKAIQLTKNKIGFIVSNAFLFSNKAQKLRNYILENTSIEKIINFEQYMVFKDASITTAIIELNKNKTNLNTVAYSFKNKKYTENYISNVINTKTNYYKIKLQKNKVFPLVDSKINDLNDKIDNNFPKLNTIIKIGKGMETAANKVFIFKDNIKQFPKEYIKKRMSGEIINKYNINSLIEYILYFENVEKFEDLPIIIQNHLIENKDFLENRADKKRRKTAKWWNYTFPMHKEFYHLDKIWCSYRAKENIFCFDNTGEYIGLTNTTVIFATNENLDLKYLLVLLNSRVLDFRHKNQAKQTGGGVFEYVPNVVEKLPIPLISKKSQQPFIEKADKMLLLNKDLQTEKNNFLKTVKEELLTRGHAPLPTTPLPSNATLPNKHKSLSISKKIQNFQNLEYDEFKKELRKQKIVINLGDENNQWREYFNTTKAKINELQSQINKTDKEIDKMVYALYELTDEEIEIVENEVK